MIIIGFFDTSCRSTKQNNFSPIPNIKRFYSATLIREKNICYDDFKNLDSFKHNVDDTDTEESFYI